MRCTIAVSLQISDEPKICTFAHVTSVYFATSKVTKEAEILQEGFSLIYRRVKLLPDGNNLDKSMYPEMNKPPRGLIIHLHR